METIKFGPIKNNETGKTKDIIVKVKPFSAKEKVALGIALAIPVWLASRVFKNAFNMAFENGAKAYDLAEYHTLDSLGLFIN